MQATEIDAFDARIDARFGTLRDVLELPVVRQLDIAPIAFLSALLTTGDLRNLRFDRDVEPTAAQPDSAGRVPSMEIVPSPNRSVYRISRRTREAMCKVVDNRGLDERRTDWMIDNYLIHELMHFAQGMSGGNHSGLGAQAPHVLLAVDYQADALAALAATVLAWVAPARFGFAAAEVLEENHWTLYVRAMEAVLDQMEIFTLLMRKDMDRGVIATMSLPIERILRIATWHYQVHRARRFNPDRPLADFQILAQPILSFRNLAWAAAHAPGELRNNWPDRELDKYDSWRQAVAGTSIPVFAPHECAPLIVTGATQFATTRFVRQPTTTPQHYANAFVGIFDNNLRASQELFTTLFANEKWLLGHSAQTAFNPAWDVQEVRSSSLASLSAGLAMDLALDNRLRLLNALLTPTRFPLVRYAAG